MSQVVAVLGAGKIGRMIAHFLGRTGDYRVRIGDMNPAAAEAAAARVGNGATAHAIDLQDVRTLDSVLDGAAAVLSSCPYECNPVIAEQAVRHGAHYLDLTEDVETTRKVLALESQSTRALIPQCGLAPGFVTIAATHLVQQLDTCDTLRLRVGALPRFPANRLKYNLTWSTNGLVNEYGNPCEILRDGEIREAMPLQDLEEIEIDGVLYEAFNTSGGVGSLCRSLRGRARNVNYKTMRYPGHCDLMRFLMNDLDMRNDRPTLERILERVLPTTPNDQVVVFVSAIGRKNGMLTEHTYARTIRHQEIDGVACSAIQVTTAAGICGVLDLLLEGKLPQRGFVRQEDVDYEAFVANRFGRYYA